MVSSGSSARPPLRKARFAGGARKRRTVVERPINGRLVRTASLLVVPAVLLLAFTIARPGPLPAPTLPSSFDGGSATVLATELARDYPDRAPGSLGAAGAARWYAAKLDLYGLRAAEDAWDESIPGLGLVRLRNLVTVVPGTSDAAIVFVAHRDNTGVGPGANDNATGTAALIELARAYARLGTEASRPQPQHTLVFLSSDGGAFGGFGAERFAATSPLRGSVRAVVSLDGLAGRSTPRLVIAGFAPRSPTPALVRTADARVASQLGRTPARPGWLVQLVDLGVPFGYGEQAPFLGRRISAVRLATADDAGGDPAADTAARLDQQRFAELGRAAEGILASLDAGIELAGGTASYVYLGDRVVRGWTIELVLLAALVPFLVGAIDLFSRCRRRGLPLAGAWRGLRTRFGFWLWVGAVVGIGALAGVFPRGSPIPPPPHSPAVTDWPVVGLLVLAGLIGLGWWRVQRTGVKDGAPSSEELLAGYAVSLVALGAVGVATALVSPYGLVFLLPSLYAWLWLPQVENGSGWIRDALYGVGLVGPVLALVVIATELGLGWNAPLYAVSLMTLGFIPWTTVLVLIGWAAVATQLGALAAGRYKPRRRRQSAR